MGIQRETQLKFSNISCVYQSHTLRSRAVSAPVAEVEGTPVMG